MDTTDTVIVNVLNNEVSMEPNVSDVNIPVECIGYKIIIKNNVHNMVLKEKTATKYLKKLKITQNIDNTKKTITFTLSFTKNDNHIFNKLLDNSSIDITSLTIALDSAYQYFEDYEVSVKVQTQINKYINSIGKNELTWTGLFEKPDYNLCLYKNRTLPFFNIECKDWVKSNLDAMKQDYPSEIIQAVSKNKKNENVDEYEEELKTIVTKNNNFLEWVLLSINEYPDMSQLVYRVLTLNKIGLKKHALALFLRLLLSPKECHIIKEVSMWDLFKPMMSNKYIESIIQYCYCYAMYILRQEETIMFSQVNEKYRVLFTLDQAANLPTFENAHIERDPYVLQLTDDTRVSDCIPFYVKKGRSINNRDKFNRRFHLATAGAFKDVNLKEIGASITGSILIPCVHTSPLEKGFEDVDWNRDRLTTSTPFPFMCDTPDNSEDFAFLNYLEYYYPSYVSLTDKDYTEQVLKKAEITVKKSDVEVQYDNDDVVKPVTTTIELAAINNSVQLEVENKSVKPSVEYNQLADIDISITTKDYELFKKRALELYDKIVQNCKHRGDVYIKEIKTLASVKYKIYGPGVSRPMDIFRIPYDPAKMVKKFHVHAVKMYYDGDITMFRSCIASLLSGVNESYKWFSCNKNPSDVLMKYAQRGISIILNKKERDAISNYIETNERWGQMLKYLDIKSNKIYCSVTADHPFFKPGLYGCGIRMGLRNFERDCNGQYASSLVIDNSKSLFPFGDLQLHTTKNWYVPNHLLINEAIEYISNEEISDDDL